MRNMLNADAAAGLVATALGAVVVAYSLSSYSVGTPRSMGPGFFPVGLGSLLVFIGVILTATSLKGGAPLPRLNPRPWVVIPLAILAFALLLPRAGFGPAGVVAMIVAAFAERRPALPGLLLLVAVLVPVSWALFSQGLGIPLNFLVWRI